MIHKFLSKKSLIIILTVTVFVSGTAFKNNFFEIAKQIEIFTTLFKEVNMLYVDDTNPGDLMDTAIKSMLKELDPYTRFLNEQDVEASRINQTGDYSGIGASVRTLKDKLIIVEPYKGYPADKSGLKAGDEIIKVNNVLVSDFKDDADNLLKGASGTTVKVTYLRQGKTNTATITREAIEIHAVPHFSMINEDTGYIVLQKFNRKASKETSNAVRNLKSQGAKKLILDLRGNPGGLLKEAVNVANVFLPKGQLIVSTKSKVKKFNKTYYTKNLPVDTEIPLVVIVNGKSASSSEIVSGSLQDLDRAVVIGSRSYGKGLVQRPKKLTYGTQARITISRYYTPSGRCIQALDYLNKEDGKALRVKEENYTAFKTKNGRTVYDGGGIQPDIELETSKYSTIVKAILKENLIFDYATKFYYQNTISDIKSFEFNDSQFNDFKSFLKTNNFNFETKTEKALNKALAEAKKESLDMAIESNYNSLLSALNSYKTKAIDDNKQQLKSLLTDEIVKRYVYREGLYENFVNRNPEIQKSVTILNNQADYKKILK